MKRATGVHFPKMREQRLIIDELSDEVLVYDLDRHQAHCLNQAAALVWRRCDGKTQPAEIARRLQTELDRPFNVEMVWLALRQLDKIHLLVEPVGLPPKLAGMNRREMVRTLGLAAVVAVPLVTSIVSPTAVQASTCTKSGKNCTTSAECCSKICDTSSSPFKCA
jgi:Coenzyme PQQ synthesis protein D (PqqD)